MKAPKQAADFMSLSVLVVDDIVNMRRTIKNMLRYIGFERIYEAGDGEKALERIQSGTELDLVVCDWNMPTMHGLDLLRQVRKIPHFRALPFIMVTAEISEAKIVQAAEEAVDGYLLKPFVAKQLEEKIKSVLKNRAEPTPFEKHMRAAQMLVEAASFNTAADEYQKALEIKPDSARARAEMGDLLIKAGDIESAQGWLKQAVDRNPNYIKAHEMLAEVQTQLGNEAGALASLERAGELSPNNPERQVKLGKMYIKQGDEEKADVAFRIALNNSDHSPELHAAIGEVYLSSGQDDKAAEAFSSSLGINEDVHIYNRLGIALRRKGKFDEAEKVYEKALRVEPRNEGVLYNFARLYLERDMKSAAIEKLKRALRIDPDFIEAQTLLNKIK